MSCAYVDTSYILAIAFGESGSSRYLRKMGTFSRLVSCALIEAEALSACRRNDWNPDFIIPSLLSIQLVHPSISLVEQLSHILKIGYVRGADALHLATALWFATDLKSQVSFLTLDEAQSKAAKTLGFT